MQGASSVLKSWPRWLALVVATSALAACGGGGSTRDEPVLDPVTTEPSLSTGLGQQETFTGDPLDDPSSLLSQRVVFFEFNSSQVTDEGRQVIEAHSNYLVTNPDARVTLEGHADERGTREYNLALGEQRADSVQQIMALIGVEVAQLELVSYGEERPLVEGHDDVSWSQNRRVEFIYRAR